VAWEDYCCGVWDEEATVSHMSSGWMWVWADDRFEMLHARAIGWPEDRFEYLGIDDDGDTTAHYAGEVSPLH
jgi:hypothetical protein